MPYPQNSILAHSHTSWLLVSSSSLIPFHIPPSQSKFPFTSTNPSLIFWGCNFLTRLTELLHQYILWRSFSFILSGFKEEGTFPPKQLWCLGSTMLSVPVPGQSLAYRSNQQQLNCNFLKPSKDSNGLVVLVCSIWLSNVEFSLKKN